MSRSGKKNQAARNRAHKQQVIEQRITEEILEAETFVDATDYPTGEVDEKQLRLLIRDWRKGRATRTLLEVLTDGYVVLFSAAVVIAMAVSVVIQAQAGNAGCETDGCHAARTILPWAMLAGVLAFVAAVARLFGPVLASMAEGFWVMEAPIKRSRLLNGRLFGAIGLGFVVGAIIGLLVTSLGGASWTLVGAWTAAGGLAAAAVTAFAAAEQGAARTWTVRVVQTILTALSVVAFLLVVAISAGWLELRLSGMPLLLAVGVGVAALAILIASVLLARSRLDLISRSKLVSGGSLAAGMQGAAFALDFSLMRDMLVERAALERGSVKPTSGRGKGAKALTWRDIERLKRNPRPLIPIVLSLLVPYAGEALGLGRLLAPVAGLVLVIVLVPLMDSLRVLSRTKGLARCLPFSTSDIRAATTYVPMIVATIWAMLAAPAFIGFNQPNPLEVLVGASSAVLSAAAGLLGAIRWVTAKGADYTMPMMATGFGALPPGLMLNLIRGIDMVALVTLPLVLGWSPLISGLLAVAAYALLRQGSSTEELRAESEQTKRELEEARQKNREAEKARRNTAGKIVVQRKQR